jgi:hypothetical protein
MYARVATFEGTPDGFDRAAERVREQMAGETPPHPAIKGGLMLVDKGGGRALGITFFESREAIEEAAQTFERMGDEIPEAERGRRVSVDVYEVAAERLP